MSTLSKAFGTFGELATTGVWVDGPLGIRCKIAMLGSDRYTKRLARIIEQRLAKSGPRGMRRGQIDYRIEANRRAAAETLLLDWSGFNDDDGNPIPYSPDAGEKAFIESPVFYNWVLERCSEVERFDREAQQDEEGNSSNVSALSSPRAALPPAEATEKKTA